MLNNDLEKLGITDKHTNENLDFILQKYEGGELTGSNHTSDNSFIMCKDIDDFKKRLDICGVIYLGITDKYTYKRLDSLTDLAMVFKVDDEVYWFHYMTLSIHSLILKELSKKDKDKMKNWKKTDEIIDWFQEKTGIKF
jgi:hypothetical protein